MGRIKDKILSRLYSYLWTPTTTFDILAWKRIKGHLYVFAHVRTKDMYGVWEEVVGLSNDGAVARSVISPDQYEYTKGGSIYREAQRRCWEIAEQIGLPVGRVKLTPTAQKQ